MYHKHYKEKGEKFAQSFESYLYGLREVFGNMGLLAIIPESRCSYDELVKKVYSKKIQIRERYANDNIGIVTNYGKGSQNYIKIIDTKGMQTEPRILNGIGNYRISNLTILHCPDPDIQTTREE